MITLFLFTSNSNLQASAVIILPQVGLIPDGPIADQGFNQLAYGGLTRAFDEILISFPSVYQPAGNTELDYDTAIAQCVAAGNSLCITVGFMMGNATMNAATNNPSVHFAIVDMTWDEADYPSNLRGMHFAVEEAAYLAGTLAGFMTETDKISIVAGMAIPPIAEFTTPYTYGAQWANHQAYVMLDYANDFGNEALGAEIAQSQIDRGSDVILGVGGLTGIGAIKQACTQNKYCISVDVDAYNSVFDEGIGPGVGYLLNSILKRVDNAVYDTITTHVNDSFTPGTYRYDIENGGVGLAGYHYTEADVPPEVKTYLNGLAAGIANGSVDVWQPFYTNFIYLPTLVR